MNKLIGLRAVNLVRGEPDRLAKFAQERHDFLIEGRDAGTGIDDQDDSIGFTKRRVSLSVNPSTNNFVFNTTDGSQFNYYSFDRRTILNDLELLNIETNNYATNIVRRGLWYLGSFNGVRTFLTDAIRFGRFACNLMSDNDWANLPENMVCTYKPIKYTQRIIKL